MNNVGDCVKPEDLIVLAKECAPVTDATHLQPSWQANQVTSGSQWVKARDFLKTPKPRDFKMVPFSMPELDKREIMVEVVCWSVENYMRDFDVKRDTAMLGETVARVIASRHKDFEPGALVSCAAGWRTHWVFDPDLATVRRVKETPELPPSVWLGPLGMPGLMAYFSFLDICLPRPGKVVLINAGAGSVGSVVGQLAKIKGCKVIAFAASRARCCWMRELGFDYVFRKAVTVSAALRFQAPTGVDFFFDCVGANFTVDAVQHMKQDGTICVFGYNSSYARRVRLDEARLRDPYSLLYMRHGKVVSCSLMDFQDRFQIAQDDLLEWMKQGKLRTRQTMVEGFGRLPEALETLYDDASVGTVFVKSETFDNLPISDVSKNETRGEQESIAQ